MESAPRSARLIKFGVFEADLEACELRKSGMRMKLGGQPFQVLQLLVEHPQEVVSRDALKQHLWPQDTHVDYDLALKRLINRLRDVLGDSAESPRFIETIPRLGYRFIAPVTTDGNGFRIPVRESASDQSLLRALRRQYSWGIWVAATLLFAALLALGYGGFRELRIVKSAPPPNIRSLAVLPLANLSPDPNQDYFSDGLTDALITDLAKIGSFKVISRTSTLQYKRTTKPLPQIAGELNVDGIVEGTVQRSGDRVRVSLQLVEGRSDQHIWAASYERPLSDVFALERDLTAEIASEIRVQLTSETKAKLTSPQPVNPKALEAYWQAKYYDRRYEAGLGDKGKKKAAAYYEQSIAADPSFALAYTGLAGAHFRMSPEDEDLDIIQAAAEKAVALDPKLTEAHIVLGEADWAVGRWAEAEQQFRVAIALNPNDVGAHSSLGNVLEVTKGLDEGLKEQQIAQSLDPAHDHLSGTFYYRRQYDRAIELLQRSAQSYPEAGYRHWDLAQNYLQKRMTKEWVSEVGAFMASVGFPEIAGHLQRAATVGGYRGALRQWAKELEHLRAHRQFYWPGVTAQAYAMLGDKERAFYWLEDAYTHRRESYNDPYLWGRLRIDPGFDSLRSDPRYENLLRRLGLPV